MASNSTNKGRVFEKFVADRLTEAGYEIQFKSVLSTKMVFVKGRPIYLRRPIDFANRWDIVATRKMLDGVAWMFVQCKCNKNDIYGKKGEFYREWARKNAIKGMNCFFAIKTKEGRKTAMELIPIL